MTRGDVERDHALALPDREALAAEDLAVARAEDPVAAPVVVPEDAPVVVPGAGRALVCVRPKRAVVTRLVPSARFSVRARPVKARSPHLRQRPLAAATVAPALLVHALPEQTAVPVVAAVAVPVAEAPVVGAAPVAVVAVADPVAVVVAARVLVAVLNAIRRAGR